MVRPNTLRASSMESLIINTRDALPDNAIEIYQFWMHHNPETFCRIVNSDRSRLFWYDRESNVGLFADRTTGHVVDLGELPNPNPMEWETRILPLLDLAKEINETLSIRADATIRVNNLD